MQQRFSLCLNVTVDRIGCDHGSIVMTATTRRCTTFDLDDEIEAVDGRPSDKIDASPFGWSERSVWIFREIVKGEGNGEALFPSTERNETEKAYFKLAQLARGRSDFRAPRSNDDGCRRIWRRESARPIFTGSTRERSIWRLIRFGNRAVVYASVELAWLRMARHSGRFLSNFCESLDFNEKLVWFFWTILEEEELKITKKVKYSIVDTLYSFENIHNLKKNKIFSICVSRIFRYLLSLKHWRNCG